MSRSERLYKRACRLIPGGVNSPVRAFKPYPFFTSRAEGSKIYDVDGRVYIDYCMAYGPLILGHVHPEVVEAVVRQLKNGSIYGTPTELEVELAELVSEVVPCMEMLRLVNSGAEATMHAIRVARGYTGRDKIVKFEGCYHGAYDYVLVKAGSGASKLVSPTSLGVPDDAVRNTLVLPFNDTDTFDRVVEEDGDDIAAVIVEPVIGNFGVIPPRDRYLNYLRKVTEEKGIVLIFDEVITGFRLALGGAQEYYGVTPDLATLGKIIGGGLPLAAFGGRRELMSLISPVGEVYQAGTFSGNPVSVTAGLTTLKILVREKDLIYSRLKAASRKIRSGLEDYIRDGNLAARVNSVGSMFTIFFTDRPIFSYSDAKTSDVEMFNRFHHRLLKNGVFVPPSQFESCFISTAHTDEDLDRTVEAMGSAMRSL